MARPEERIDPAGGAIAELGTRLRAVREEAGRSYRAMASKTHYHHATLSRAANGHDVPSWACVKAYLGACGIRTPDQLQPYRELWETAAAVRTAAKQANGATNGATRDATKVASRKRR